MRIVLIGGTGLVGSRLVPRMLSRGHELHAVQRRASGFQHDRLVERVTPAGEWRGIVGEVDAEAAISTLGTTMRKAGSEQNFRSVDHGIVLDFGRAARAAGARRMVTVSSVGADARSSNFYLRLKGEVEEELGTMGFDRLDIIRPGLLQGPRGGDRRLGERIGILVSPIANLVLRGPLDRYAAIDATVVADAMAELLVREEPGVFVHHNRDLHRLVKRSVGY